MMMLALHLMVDCHFMIWIISIATTSLILLGSSAYKGIDVGVGLLDNNSYETFFIGGRLRQTVHGVDEPIKSFRYLDL